MCVVGRQNDRHRDTLSSARVHAFTMTRHSIRSKALRLEIPADAPDWRIRLCCRMSARFAAVYSTVSVLVSYMLSSALCCVASASATRETDGIRIPSRRTAICTDTVVAPQESDGRTDGREALLRAHTHTRGRLSCVLMRCAAPRTNVCEVDF